LRDSLRTAIAKHKLHWAAKAEIVKQQQKKMIKEDTARTTKSLLATARVNTYCGDVGLFLIFRNPNLIPMSDCFGIRSLKEKEEIYSLGNECQ